MRTFVILTMAGFLAFCGLLVVDSGLFSKACSSTGCILLQQTMDEGRAEGPTAGTAAADQGMSAALSSDFSASGGRAKSITIGAEDPNTEDPEDGFKVQCVLNSKGASIERVTFSNGNNKGFDDRDPDDPQPLVMLSPVEGGVLSMANREFVLVEQGRQLSLDRLSWKSFDIERGFDSRQTARFEATVSASGEPLFRLVKTYTVHLDSYLVDCNISVENLSDSEQKVRFNLGGPVGIGREGSRSDMRKVVGGFRSSTNEVVSSRKDIRGSANPCAFLFGGQKLGLKAATQKYEEARRSGNRAQIDKAKEYLRIGSYLPDKYAGANFLWVAAVNKYFAAILVPLPENGQAHCKWVSQKSGRFYNPDGDASGNSGDETVGVDLRVAKITLGALGGADSSRTYGFQLYLGPKDKGLFDKNERYRRLGFVQTIDFMGCCCPASIIRPLAFGILAVMKWMFGFIHNYGVVIIVLVFVFRGAIHPLTKKSQVSMSTMSKLAPKIEEIKKKYANNKAELNKQMMAVYREQGATPIMGMLPMFVQMPIWISLWSAIYTSIDLRGAPFCLWIQDLSVPDALFRFGPVTVPLFGKLDSFNLLPLLMGVAFYLQQRLMPKQTAAGSQAAQQQKMMMIMMPLLFPLMLYKAPSGVNLYIMASTFAGVVEQYFIKKHIREKEEAESQGLVSATSKTGGKVKKKKPKPFFRTH
jgi:YidC/Oxa1 family membrane protein insertase